MVKYKESSFSGKDNGFSTRKPEFNSPRLYHGGVVQGLERRFVRPEVAGSIPATVAIFKAAMVIE